MIVFLFPLFAVAILGFALSFLDRGLTPIAAARLSLFTLFVGAMTTIPVFLHLTLTWLMTLPSIGESLHHALHLNGVHLAPQTWLGPLAALFSLFAVVRLLLLLVTRRNLRKTSTGEILRLPTEAVFAYALPGRQASIVVSDGLTATLSQDELEIVLAHERCHVDNRHDIWLYCGRICCLLNPLLAHRFKRLRHCLERIADEAAVATCGDRMQVAQTIGKVALNQTTKQFVLGVASYGVPLRVHELMTPPERHPRWQIFGSALGVIGVASMCVLQWHHVATAVATVCGL